MIDCLKAWEALQELELITPVDKGVTTKVQKEFRLFTLQVLPDQILAVVDANAPLTVKEWAIRSVSILIYYITKASPVNNAYTAVVQGH